MIDALKTLGKIFYCFILTVILLSGCRNEKAEPIDNNGRDLSDIPYNPEPYEIVVPPNFPPMPQPEDNIATEAGVRLGRFLFYDPILSIDSTISCSSCHKQELYFTDGRAVSIGVDGLTGRRSAMSLVNVGYYDNGLFWDGRVATLEEQALHPIKDPVEMNNTWENVEMRLRKHTSYPEMFRRAFGITSSDEITRELVTKAIAQFERTIVSTGNSKWDRIHAPGSTVIFSDKELEGKLMYFDEVPELPDAECGHCHTGFLFTTNLYRNNGIDTVDNLLDFDDYGRGEVTGNKLDNGKFRIPTLRNVLYTAPYMHDGRFKTIDAVLKHYNSGGHNAINTGINIHPLGLSEQQIDQILAFLKTLSDTSLVNIERYSNPFK